MWAGTIRGGLFGIKEVHMRTYRDVSPGNHYGMSDKRRCAYMKMRTELSGSGPMAGD